MKSGNNPEGSSSQRNPRPTTQNQVNRRAAPGPIIAQPQSQMPAPGPIITQPQSQMPAPGPPITQSQINRTAAPGPIIAQPQGNRTTAPGPIITQPQSQMAAPGAIIAQPQSQMPAPGPFIAQSQINRTTAPGPIITQPQGNLMAAPGPFIMLPQGNWVATACPLIAQPQVTSMTALSTNPNCPPGLEYLSQIDRVLVQQNIEVLEILTGCETNNRYQVKNVFGQIMYLAQEENDCCTRNCCGPQRPFEMSIVDYMQQEVIHLYRPLACQSCCFPCCLQTLEVSSPPGTVIGTIEQEWSVMTPKFNILDALGNVVLRIEGPVLTVSCCGDDVEFEVLTPDGDTQVGKISKNWSGFVKEAFTDADNFGVNFPIGLDVKMKAVVLGACFLIDYMYFETTDNNY